MRLRPELRFALVALACASLTACAYYGPGVTLAPVLRFRETIEGPTKGAPQRMLDYNRELDVQCAYCHVDADATTGDLTPEGTCSRFMIDLADKFKVTCAHCHDASPKKLTPAGRLALRDMRDPARRWECAKCHDVAFKVRKRP